MADQLQSQVLIVDDSPAEIQLMLEYLQDDFAVAVATSGSEALSLIRNQNVIPQVVLLDVTMPEMDGHTVCRQLKAIPDCAATEVLFVSANDSLEEKLRGYDSGGGDYLTKPVEPTELAHKVRLAVHRHEKQKAMEAQAQSAMDAALTAIVDAGEQSNVIHFLRDCFKLTRVDAVAELLANAFQHLELMSTVQIWVQPEPVYSASRLPIPPLEMELLSRLRQADRIHQQGRRLILNFGQITVLVKNLPTDADKAGRLRDQLALMLEGAVAQLNSILLQRDVSQLIEQSQQSLQVIQQQQANQKAKSVQILDALSEQLTKLFFGFQLTEEQEQLLLETIEKHTDAMLNAYEEGVRFDEELSKIVGQLNGILRSNDTVDEADDVLTFL